MKDTCEAEQRSRRWWPRATALVICGALGAIVGDLIGGVSGGAIGIVAGFVAASVPAMAAEWEQGVGNARKSLARRQQRPGPEVNSVADERFEGRRD